MEFKTSNHEREMRLSIANDTKAASQVFAAEGTFCRIIIKKQFLQILQFPKSTISPFVMTTDKLFFIVEKTLYFCHANILDGNFGIIGHFPNGVM